MDNRTNSLLVTRILPIICLLVTVGLLVAGLWPFNPFPKNKVTWLPEKQGLEFGDHGVIFSSGLVEPVRSPSNSFCSLEIRLQPKIGYVNNSATLLAFYTPENPLQFRLMQYRDELLVRRDYLEKKNRVKTVEIELEHVFAQDEPVSFSITSGPDSSVAYRNGIQAGASRGMGLSCKDLTGQLVIGNSPVSDNAWQGKLLSLAIYNWQLTPEEVSRHYAMVTANTVPQEPADKERMIARYTLAEGSGKIIHNSGGSAPDIYIPKTFKILHKKILSPPWKEFTPDNRYVRDLAINIAGFVPFGLFLCAYLSWCRQWNQAAILTILAGASISLTIEILQGFIPSRTSGVTDLITNTLGTYLGVVLCTCRPIQALATKLGLTASLSENAGQTEPL